MRTITQWFPSPVSFAVKRTGCTSVAFAEGVLDLVCGMRVVARMLNRRHFKKGHCDRLITGPCCLLTLLVKLMWEQTLGEHGTAASQEETILLLRVAVNLCSQSCQCISIVLSKILKMLLFHCKMWYFKTLLRRKQVESIQWGIDRIVETNPKMLKKGQIRNGAFNHLYRNNDWLSGNSLVFTSTVSDNASILLVVCFCNFTIVCGPALVRNKGKKSDFNVASLNDMSARYRRSVKKMLVAFFKTFYVVVLLRCCTSLCLIRWAKFDDLRFVTFAEILDALLKRRV